MQDLRIEYNLKNILLRVKTPKVVGIREQELLSGLHMTFLSLFLLVRF